MQLGTYSMCLPHTYGHITECFYLHSVDMSTYFCSGAQLGLIARKRIISDKRGVRVCIYTVYIESAVAVATVSNL